jgi:hypothetical protein
VKPTASRQTAAALILRLYGIACAGWGLIALWRALAITPDPHGVADWTRLWPEFTLPVLLGISVFLLLRWLVLAFSLLSAGIGIFYIGLTLMVVPFPEELFHLLFAILLIIPAFLTSRAWHSLR